MMRILALILIYIISLPMHSKSVNNRKLCKLQDGLKNISDNILTCQEIVSDGITLENVHYILTEPEESEGGNCRYSKINKKNEENKIDYISLKENNNCPKLLSRNYISLEYLPNINQEFVFMSVNSLIMKIQNSNFNKYDIFSAPFYKLWFCKKCSLFLKDIRHENINEILLNSISEINHNGDYLFVRISHVDKEYTLYLDQNFKINYLKLIE